MKNDLGNKKIFAENLQRYMEQHGVDRNKLCADLDFKYTTVSGWLSAEKYPRIDKIEILAHYFGIKKSDLVEDHCPVWRWITPGWSAAPPVKLRPGCVPSSSSSGTRWKR